MKSNLKTMVTTAMAVVIAISIHKLVTKTLNLPSATDTLALASGR